MANDVKVTVSVAGEVMRHIEEEARRRGKSRSAMIEEALRAWQRLELDRQLAQGYAASAESERADAEAWVPLVEEALDGGGEGAGGRPKGGRVARHVRGKRK